MSQLYRTQVLLERQQHEALQTLAAAEGRSMSEIIREAVAEYLVDQDKEQQGQMAERLGQSKAYGAQYLALASRENAPLWAADLRLVRAAQAAGLGWVHWIGE